MTDKENTYVSATCGHCGGIGCLYCNKTGTVLVAKPKRKCPHCEGIGCIYCGFTGRAGFKGKYEWRQVFLHSRSKWRHGH